MSTTLVKVSVTLTKTPTPLPTTNAPFASTSVVVTDANGPQAPVVLTGTETPPWSFTTSVAPGTGSVTATDIDTAGATIGTPITQAFTEAGTPATFQATSAIVVTPV